MARLVLVGAQPYPVLGAAAGEVCRLTGWDSAAARGAIRDVIDGRRVELPGTGLHDPSDVATALDALGYAVELDGHALDPEAAERARNVWGEDDLGRFHVRSLRPDPAAGRVEFEGHVVAGGVRPGDFLVVPTTGGGGYTEPIMAVSDRDGLSVLALVANDEALAGWARIDPTGDVVFVVDRARFERHGV